MKQKNIFIYTLKIIACSVISFFLFGSLLAVQSQAFTFGAAGDFANGTTFKATVAQVKAANPDFFLSLGDLAYATNEQNWCDGWKSSGYNNVLLISGNHDSGESSAGNINTYIQYCPYTLTGPLSGSYGKQYYFDYPADKPLARMIMISPGIGGSYLGINTNYSSGSPGYTFTANAIDDARAKGIKWIVVGMHKNYISAMEKDNELGSDLMPMLFDKKVDLILQGHEHGYERSKQLKCATTGTYNAGCVVNSTGTLTKGQGSIIAVLGTGGQDLRGLNTGDAEYPYFAKADNTTNGYGEFTITATALNYKFVKSAGGSLADNFTIADAGTPQPTATPPASAPTDIVPTFACIGGIPCTSPKPTTTTAPSGMPGASQAPGTTQPVTSPVTTVDPCATGQTSVMANGGKKHRKYRKGSSGGFLQQFIEFLLKLILLILEKLGLQLPTNPSPTPTPTPGPGTTPAPCPSPTSAVQPSVAPTSGATTPTVSTTLTPSGTADASNCTTTAAQTLGWGTPQYQSDFNTATLDPRWHPYGPEPGHNSQGTRTPAQITLANGEVTLSGKADGTTAAMSWYPGQRYGRWEACIKSDKAAGGLNSVMLLWPDAEDFPVGGEVDFMEISDDSRQSTDFFLHYGSSNSQVNGSVNADATQWNAWALEWTSQKVTAYLNGKEWYSTTNTSILPPRPMHLCLQLDYFPTAGGPTATHIDWTRQYALPESQPSTLGLKAGEPATGQPGDFPARKPRALSIQEMLQ